MSEERIFKFTKDGRRVELLDTLKSADGKFECYKLRLLMSDSDQSATVYHKYPLYDEHPQLESYKRLEKDALTSLANYGEKVEAARHEYYELNAENKRLKEELQRSSSVDVFTGTMRNILCNSWILAFNFSYCGHAPEFEGNVYAMFNRKTNKVEYYYGNRISVELFETKEAFLKALTRELKGTLTSMYEPEERGGERDLEVIHNIAAVISKYDLHGALEGNAYRWFKGLYAERKQVALEELNKKVELLQKF